MNKIQQGDVILRKLDNIPNGNIKIISKAKMVLAEGESTGHAHVIEENDSELIQIGEQIILNLQKQATITHEEHKPITLQPGIWEVGRVQEYDYFSQMKRDVQD
jgi:hypothetical protein